MGGTGCFEANAGEIVVVLRASHDARHLDARHAANACTSKEKGVHRMV